MNNFSAWLSDKLKEKNISVIQLCEETGLKRTSIYYYMKDVNRPTRDNLKKICDILGADINEAMSLFTPKKVGRPIGSVKRWGQENIVKKITPTTPLESDTSMGSYNV